MNLKLSELDGDVRSSLEALIESVVARIPPVERVRLPHAKVEPMITFGYFTLAVQDPKRKAELPACRLYYHEEVREIPTKVEKEIRLEREQLDRKQLELARKVASKLKKMAWEDYKRRFGRYFRGE